MRVWQAAAAARAPPTRDLSTCCSAVAVASVPQRTVLGVIRELEASAPVGLQARRRTLARRRRRVLPVVAPADALGEVREVARRAVWLEHAEARERGRPLRDWHRPAREWLAARVPIVLDRAPSVSAARCRRRPVEPLLPDNRHVLGDKPALRWCSAFTARGLLGPCSVLLPWPAAACALSHCQQRSRPIKAQPMGARCVGRRKKRTYARKRAPKHFVFAPRPSYSPKRCRGVVSVYACCTPTPRER